jgi:hypothetical protein
MENRFSEIRSKILKGIELSFQRLLEKKSKENGDLVFSIDGKITHIKAKDMLK